MQTSSAFLQATDEGVRTLSPQLISIVARFAQSESPIDGSGLKSTSEATVATYESVKLRCYGLD